MRLLRNDPGPMMTFYDIKGREMENRNPTGFSGSSFSADIWRSLYEAHDTQSPVISINSDGISFM